jgi:hypothetical protein
MTMAAIRFIKPFIFANGFFDVDDNVDYEAIGIRQPRESAPVRFNIDDVVAWNQGSETTITVHLANGMGYILDCEIDQFDEIMVANGSI